MVKQSKKYKLNKEDGLKILKGFGLAIAGSALVWGADIITQVDFGTFYTTLVVKLEAVGINALRKLLSSKK